MNNTKTVSSTPSEQAQITHENLPKPQGIGIAVAIDWGLAVQLLVQPFVPLFFKGTGMFKPLGTNPLLSALLYFLISLPFAALLVIFGEGVRRGWRWTGTVQLVANALLSLVGLVGLWSLWPALMAGHYWGLETSVILVIFSPLVTWRLSRSATREWFQRVTSAQARLRHGGSWPWAIACFAIVGGISQVLVGVFR